MRRALFLALSLLFLISETGAAQSAIGNWSGGGRTWNDGEFSTIRSLMTSRGHTVFSDAAISASNLSLYDVFILPELSSTPTATETSDLKNWINGGGRALVFYDSFVNPTYGNQLLADLGTSLFASAAGTANGVAKAGNFATEGGPFNIVGQGVNFSAGHETPGVGGGTQIVDNFVSVEQIGSGFVYALGDRIDHNFFNVSAANTNGQLFINLVEGESGPTAVVPEPGTWVLLATGLMGVGILARRRRPEDETA